MAIGIFTVISAIFTALISGVIAASVTYLLNANKDHVILLRQKAEELSKEFVKSDNEFSSWYQCHVNFFRNKNTYDELASSLSGISPMNESYANVKMLIGVYFTGVETEYSEYLRRKFLLDDLIVKYANQGNDKSVPLDAQRKYDECLKDFFQACPTVSQAIIREAKIVCGADALLPPYVRKWNSKFRINH